VSSRWWNLTQAVEADRLWRAQLSPGIPWYELGDGGPATALMLARAKESEPRKRSMVEDLLDRHDSMVFHPYSGEDAS
jgi:hypothetical protein